MKKTIILLAWLALCLPVVSAQDTIAFNLDSSYFCNICPSSEYNIMMAAPLRPGDSNTWLYWAKHFYTPDTITVYGIAAAYMYSDGNVPFSDTYYDTSWDNVYEYFSLYKDAVGADSLVCISDSLKIHNNDPIAYYQYFGDYGILGTYYPAFYEKYFDTPYQVQGRFYVAMTSRSGPPEDTYSYLDTITGITYTNEKRSVHLCSIGIRDGKTGAYLFDTVTIKMHFEEYWDGFDGVMVPEHIEWRSGGTDVHWMMFPIVDTTGHTAIQDPDSSDVAVGEATMANRFVSLSPNPAKGQVRVTASCGMSRLTVYNPAGETVKEMAVSGGSTTLDVAGWPSGCYVVRVKTLVGTAVKKLVVQ